MSLTSELNVIVKKLGLHKMPKYHTTIKGEEFSFGE